MSARLAFLCCLLFACWLFVKDRRRRPGVSDAIWIPCLWLVIISSRPLSMWMSGGATGGVDYSDGNIIDRLGNFTLIIAGLIVLSKRHIRWTTVISANKWLFIFFLYWAISIFWAPYPIVALKEYTKDLGNIVMVLVVLSEKNVVAAVKALFVRSAYVLIPLSVIFIKYFPDIGRAFNRWTWEYMYVGVALQKNSLGCLALLCGLFVLWDLLLSVEENVTRNGRAERLARWLLLGMCIWILHRSNSATSLICAILGAALLIVLQTQFFRHNPKVVSYYVIAAAAVFLALDGLFNLREFLVTSVGRDITLTSRTGVWELVLEQQTNPLFGAGFYSFWKGARVETIWQSFEGINQAHNGYLETYLNGGIVAVCLFAGWVLAATRSIYIDLGQGSNFARMRFVLLVVVLVYNFSEAAFNRFTPVWLAFLIATVTYPSSTTRPTQEPARECEPELKITAARPAVCSFL